MTAISINRLSMSITQSLLDDQSALGLAVENLDDGSTIIDAGIGCRGGYEAGRLIGEVCMGGLGSVRLGVTELSDTELPSVVVRTDHPLESCILSQLAGWSIKVGKFRAMGSGPARALAKAEKLYDRFAYVDDHSEAIIVLETSRKPTVKVSEYISEKCDVDPKNLYMILTPTSSLAGTIQICARVVETGVHKMHSLHIDLGQIVAGYGSCPIPPLSKMDLVMMGRTNDAMLYGGNTFYVFKDAASIIPIMKSVPSISSSDYGKPFKDLFEAAGYDFYKLDPGLFSPAVVSISELDSGKFYSAGKLNPDVLVRSFGIT